MNNAPTATLPASILVVDDNRENLRLLTGVLTQHGYAVRVAPDGHLALASVQAELPDLILLDVRMPEMDGYEVCTQLKANERTRDIPVIFISIATDVFDKVKAFSVGGVDYITKPFQMEEVLARVETHLALRVMRKQLEEKNAQLEQEIVERVRAEEALRKSEEKLRRLFDSVADGIFAMDLNGAYTEVNQRMLEIYGLNSRDEILGKSGFEFVARHDVERAMASMQETLEQGAVTSQEFSALKADGSECLVDVSGRTLRDASGNPVGFIGIVRDITEHKRTERAIERLRRQNELILNAAGEGVFGLDLQGRHTFANPAAASMLGYEVEELVGKSSHITWHHMKPDGDIYPEDECPIYAAYRDGALHRGDDEVFWSKNGTSFPVEYVSTPIWEGGELAGAVVVFRDITERRRAEEALRNSQEQLELITDTIPALLAYVDSEQRYLYVNQTYADWYEYSKEEMIGKRVKDILGAESYQGAIKYIEAVLQGRELSYENVAYDTEGRLRAVRATYVPHFDENGYVKAFLGLVEDITVRKQAEEALREYSERLEELVQERTMEVQAQYAQMETILRSVGDAILMADREMRIRYINPAFTALTGYTVEEVMEQHASSVGAGAGSEQIMHSIESALTEGKMWQGEVIGRRKDGRTYDAALTVAPIRDAEGRHVGLVSSHWDISQTKALERARSQFITNVSHQFRTPVATLKLYAHLMQQAELPEQSRHYLQTMGDQVAWLTQLVEDTLEMTALDSGRAVTAWEPLSLPILIEDTITRYRSRADPSGLCLVAMPIPPDLPIVKGDPTRVPQALREIVENALTFTPTGGQVTLEVETAEDEGRTWVTISVRDTGPGISPEEQEKVFDRFFRGELAESGHVPGTGLGLSIAQEIVRAHGGRVTVESQVGKGSTFTVWLSPVE